MPVRCFLGRLLASRGWGSGLFAQICEFTRGARSGEGLLLLLSLDGLAPFQEAGC